MLIQIIEFTSYRARSRGTTMVTLEMLLSL